MATPVPTLVFDVENPPTHHEIAAACAQHGIVLPVSVLQNFVHITETINPGWAGYPRCLFSFADGGCFRSHADGSVFTAGFSDGLYAADEGRLVRLRVIVRQGFGTDEWNAYYEDDPLEPQSYRRRGEGGWM